MEPSVRVADFEAVERHRAVLQQRLCVDTELGDVSQQLVRTEPLGSSDVLKKIENVVKETLSYLAKGEAPVITFDKRSSWENIWFDGNVGLQMVSDSAMSKVKCECPRSIHRFALILKALAMIYKLVQSNTYATKRDLYYNESQLFGSQMILDGIINDISCMLKVPRRSLHVLSTSKGCIAGDLCYTEEDGNRVNCACNSTVCTKSI